MKTKLKNPKILTAYSIGPYPIGRLWNSGWQVQWFRRIGPILILKYTKVAAPRRFRRKSEPWVTPKLCLEFATLVALASLAMIFCSVLESW
jgi:hypothetical protein